LIAQTGQHREAMSPLPIRSSPVGVYSRASEIIWRGLMDRATDISNGEAEVSGGDRIAHVPHFSFSSSCNGIARTSIAAPFRSSAASDDESDRRGDVFPHLEIFFGDGRFGKFGAPVPRRNPQPRR
jgi:hypothetical protein